jgi:hypothetical protein
MTRSEKKMLEKQLDLIFEFEKYVIEHPNFTKRIPRNAIISMRVDGDKSFNRWSQRLTEKHTNGKKVPVFLINVKEMRPAASRIQRLRIERAA